MNSSAAAEDAEPRMLGVGESEYLNDHLKKKPQEYEFRINV